MCISARITRPLSSSLYEATRPAQVHSPAMALLYSLDWLLLGATLFRHHLSNPSWQFLCFFIV